MATAVTAIVGAALGVVDTTIKTVDNTAARKQDRYMAQVAANQSQTRLSTPANSSNYLVWLVALLIGAVVIAIIFKK